MTADRTSVPDGYEFALCLSHDVDRPYKRLQAPYYALTERRLSHLRALRSGVEPGWQFDAIRELESSLGVRSAFYFLCEQHLLFDRRPTEWLKPYYWIEHVGRYDPRDAPVADVVRDLDAGGWEVGLHGSLGTHEDIGRLRYEKEVLESVLGHDVLGARQHHLRLSPPATWGRQAALGLRYDASLGSNVELGFSHGYDLVRPFDDDFVVFPLTIMDKTLAMRSDGPEEMWRRCESLLQEARQHDAVMTVNWHLRNFNENDYPGHARLYRRLVERAQELGAWVGSPGQLYERLDTTPRVRAEA